MAGVSNFKGSFCQERGYQDTFFFLEERTATFIEYSIPSLSIIPPHTDGCFINMYYKNNVLEETFYISKQKQTRTKFGNWKIKKEIESYRRDHYRVFKIVPLSKIHHKKSSIPGKGFFSNTTNNLSRVGSLLYFFK